MRYTIEGFSQLRATTLEKTIVRKGKEHKIQIDFADLAILRWFVDFYPSMKKIQVDGREYAWVLYSKVLTDLPLLKVSKRGCADRFEKLVEFGILDFRLLKQGGTFSLYSFGENYMYLVDTDADLVGDQPATVGDQPATPLQVELQHRWGSTRNPVADQPAYKDSSTKDKSIIDIERKEESKEEKKTKKKILESYDELISAYTENADVRTALTEFVKMRKLIKKPLSNYAFTRLLTRLDKLSGGDAQKKVDILDRSIVNGWQDIFEWREDGKRGGKANAANHRSGGGNDAQPARGAGWGKIL